MTPTKAQLKQFRKDCEKDGMCYFSAVSAYRNHCVPTMFDRLEVIMTLPAHAVASHGIIDPFAASPSATAAATDPSDDQIANRWSRMTPHLRLLGLPHDAVSEADHRRECRALLREGIPWRAIMRLGLDDPTVHISTRLTERERYLDRQRRAQPRKPRGPNLTKEPS